MAHGSRRGPVALVVLLVLSLAAALLVGAPAQAGRGGAKDTKHGKPARPADKPWAGFAIAGDAHASGGFLGARILNGAIVYRIDPQAKQPVAKTFSAPVYVDTLLGSGKRNVTTLDTQRAAWIVGKYGAYRLKIQTAAVELALDDLLVGGPYALGGSRTKARLAQLPAAKQKRIRSFAEQMLAGAAEYASTYSVTMTSTPSVTVGDPVTVSLRVVNTANGAGIARLPVAFAYPGAPAPAPVVTDATGTATATFSSTAAGPQTITGSVANVPETRLVVLTPTTRKASRVVVADVKTAGAATAITAVRAVPTTAIRTSYGSIATPYRTTGQTFTLAGTYPSARTATASLFGPYTSDALARCTGGAAKVVGKGAIAVKAASTGYKLPTVTLPAKGYYRWLLTVPADAYNNAPAPLCGGVMVRTGD